jgi:glyoxylase-like metal-dependent hydrolase (beta-lactamase superfamily II)
MFEPILVDAYNPSPMTGRGNNTYLIVGTDKQATLVDAGAGRPDHLADIARHIAGRHATLREVLVTHAHPDHASGAPAIASAHFRARFFKRPWPDEDRKVSVQWEPIDEGDTIECGGGTLIVLHTPGHSPDHLAFWHEASRTVFTGDLVAKGSSVMIEASRGGSLAKYLASLERIRDLKPLRLLPAHGSLIDDPESVLTQYLEHRLMRERQVLDALAKGRDTIPAIAESIYDGLNPVLMPAARENVRAHLEKLKQEGTAFEQDGRWTI